MTVKAKFKCNSVTTTEYNKTANLNAVYGTTGENADFSKATPNGQLQITIDKDAVAANFFIPGLNYYMTFEPEQLTP